MICKGEIDLEDNFSKFLKEELNRLADQLEKEAAWEEDKEVPQDIIERMYKRLKERIAEYEAAKQTKG